MIARLLVKLNFHDFARLAVFQFQFAGPRRHTVFFRPQLNQEQLVPEITQILQRLIAPGVIEKIGDDDQQPALYKGPDEVARQHREIVLRPWAGSRSDNP